MRRTTRGPALFFALVALGSALPTSGQQEARAETTAQEEDPLARIIIYSPAEGKPALGAITFRADILSSRDVREVRLRLDGREVATFLEPPYEMPLDLGEENVGHRFEVVVLGYERELARTSRRTPPIRVDDEVNLGLRQLYATVSRDGTRVGSLEQEDFTILDDGRTQELVTFEGGDAALAAAILVDASISMQGERLRAAVAGARAFFSGLRDLDEASLFLFSDRLLFRSAFAEAGADVEGRLETIRAAGGTALNDHLFLALKQLESRQGRRVVIVLSDGVDVDSTLTMEDVLWMERRSRSIVYWIRLQHQSGEQPAVMTLWRNVEEHQRELERLELAVEESGGRIVAIADTDEARAAFEEVLRELREQYVLGYYPDVEYDDGRWREVSVRVHSAALEVRTRGGYVDDP